MTRSELVAKLAERFSQLAYRDAEFAATTILDAMTDALLLRPLSDRHRLRST